MTIYYTDFKRKDFVCGRGFRSQLSQFTEKGTETHWETGFCYAYLSALMEPRVLQMPEGHREQKGTGHVAAVPEDQ